MSERRPSLLVGAGHLAALWALAFAQPLFDLLGRNPDFFIARGNTRVEIVVFALTFTLAPPLAMLLVEAAVIRVSWRLRWAIHLLLVGLLGAALVLQALKHLAAGPAGLLIAAALVAGALIAAIYSRTAFLRSMLDVLIPAPIVVLAVFLLFSGASKLVFPESQAKAASLAIPSRAPVVMVVFDEFPEGSMMTRRGTIDSSRFPAFAELARHSTWYRGATTVAGFTSRAVPTVLTGALPDEDELPTSSDQPHSIFTLLGSTYRMHVMEEATQICPAQLCGDEGRGDSPTSGLGSLFSDLRVVSEHLLLPDGIRRHLPAVDATFGDFANEATELPPRLRFAHGNGEQLAAVLNRQETDNEITRVARFEEGIDGRPRVLHLIHVNKPHYPWIHFPNGRTYSNLSSDFKGVLADDSTWEGPPSLTDLALQRHLLESGFTDRLLGEVIERMKRVGIWDRALLVVTADHGGAVIAHQPRRNPTPANLGQVAPVPLLVKAPGQRTGRILDRHVCTSDEVPIIARLLGIHYPWARTPCPPGEVTVANSPSGEASLGFEAVQRARDAYIDRIARLFGNNTGWGPVLRFRPHQALIGKPVATLPRLPAGAEEATIDEAQRLQDVDPLSPASLVSLVRGRIEGGEPGEALAAAANGRIAAVGRSFESLGENTYSMLVPPRFFHAGANRVEIYRVLERRGRPSLALLGP